MTPAIHLLATLFAGVVLPPQAASQQAIAVIVNRSNPLNSVNAEDLKRLFLGTTTVFPNRERVTLYEQADLRESFYRTVLMMNGDRVKRYWIGVVFTGSSAIPPKSVSDPGEVRDFVSRRRGAVAFVDARVVDQSVKVLTVEGSRPGDADYSLWVINPQ